MICVGCSLGGCVCYIPLFSLDPDFLLKHKTVPILTKKVLTDIKDINTYLTHNDCLNSQ